MICPPPLFAFDCRPLKRYIYTYLGVIFRNCKVIFRKVVISLYKVNSLQLFYITLPTLEKYLNIHKWKTMTVWNHSMCVDYLFFSFSHSFKERRLGEWIEGQHTAICEITSMELNSLNKLSLNLPWIQWFLANFSKTYPLDSLAPYVCFTMWARILKPISPIDEFQILGLGGCTLCGFGSPPHGK